MVVQVPGDRDATGVQALIGEFLAEPDDQVGRVCADRPRRGPRAAGPWLERGVPFGLVPGEQGADPGPGDPIAAGDLADQALLDGDGGDDQPGSRHPASILAGRPLAPAPRRAIVLDVLRHPVLNVSRLGTTPATTSENGPWSARADQSVRHLGQDGPGSERRVRSSPPSSAAASCAPAPPTASSRKSTPSSSPTRSSAPPSPTPPPRPRPRQRRHRPERIPRPGHPDCGRDRRPRHRPGPGQSAVSSWPALCPPGGCASAPASSSAPCPGTTPRQGRPHHLQGHYRHRHPRRPLTPGDEP
jgi:hypothetical protein